jgi:hypothetical protein
VSLLVVAVYISEELAFRWEWGGKTLFHGAINERRYLAIDGI